MYSEFSGAFVQLRVHSELDEGVHTLLYFPASHSVILQAEQLSDPRFALKVPPTQVTQVYKGFEGSGIMPAGHRQSSKEPLPTDFVLRGGGHSVQGPETGDDLYFPTAHAEQLLAPRFPEEPTPHEQSFG